MAAEVTTVPSLPNTDHRNTFDIVSSVSPSSAPPTAQSQRPRAIDVNIGSCGDHGNGLARSPTANEERAQRSSARGGISRACPLTLGLISKTCLPRGGTYVSTVIGPIQIGIPPETIKDSMALGLPVPQYFLLPPETFCRTLGNSLGVNVAEFEFPAYFNFFLKNQTVKLIVESHDAERRVRALMQETLLGPVSIDPDLDFSSSMKPGDRPDLMKELSYFRGYNGKELSVDTLVSFVRMDQHGLVTISGEDGTPGAGKRLTIAASDSNGGEYVITEFEHVDVPDRETSLHSDARAPDSEGLHGASDRDVEDESHSKNSDGYGGDNGENGGNEGRHSEANSEIERAKAAGAWDGPLAPTERQQDTVFGRSQTGHLWEVQPTHLANVGLSGRNLEEDGEKDEDKDADTDFDYPYSGIDVGADSSVGKGEGGGREMVDQRCTEAGIEGGSNGTRRDQSYNDNGNTIEAVEGRTSSRPTPMRPLRQKPQHVGGAGVSAVKRFARSLVRSTARGVGCGSREGASNPMIKAASDGLDGPDGDAASERREDATVRAGGSKESRQGLQKERQRGKKPTRGTSVRGGAGASIKGFRPIRQAVVSMICPLPSQLPFHPAQTEEEFVAPTFGVTVLGNSHGFDPKGSTSGYVLWISGRGYMIDPPPYASMILQSFNIRPSLIAGVIVTHCHADHDAGTFQKVLLDGQINIVSTRTIYQSFIRKYSALSGMNPGLIQQSHKFTPVTIGDTLRLHGASFEFFYTLHSIPCVGFEVTFGGKGMAFSADHMNDPARIRAMCDGGVLSEGRRDALLNFPWHHDVIFHEAGIPPIHTPMRTLEELSHDIKSRLYVVHVSQSSIPEGSGLRVAPVGVEHTIRLQTPGNSFSGAMEVLDFISSVGMLSNISVGQARSLLEVGRKVVHKAGTSVQHRNVDVNHFAIICHGKAIATITKEAGSRKSFAIKETILRRGDCYGEELLLAGSVRRKGYVSIKTVTDVEKAEFHETQVLLFSGRDLEQIINLRTKKLEDNHRLDRLLVHNSVLAALSRKQVLQLESLTEAQALKAGQVVWKAGQPVERVVLVAQGRLAFRFEGPPPLMHGACIKPGRRLEAGERQRRVICPESFLPGSMIGRAGTLLDPPGRNAYRQTLVAKVDSVVLVISREDMTIFSYSNPGVFMSIHDLQFVC